MNEVMVTEKEPIQFVTMRTNDHRDEKEFFLIMFKVFEYLKIHSERRKLHPIECTFIITPCLMEPGRSDYTIRIKDECM